MALSREQAKEVDIIFITALIPEEKMVMYGVYIPAGSA